MTAKAPQTEFNPKADYQKWLEAALPHSVTTIEAGQSFSSCLARFILEAREEYKLPIENIRLLLPTRRSCQLLQESFLRENNGKPMLLPQMLPVGAPDQEEIFFLSDLDASDLPPPIDPVRRALMLVRPIQRAFGADINFEQAFALATSLGQFIDALYVEDLTLDDLERLVEGHDSLAANWQRSVVFLNSIIREFWPDLLAQTGCVDPGAYRVHMVHQYRKILETSHWHAPVIIAGTMASVPSIASLAKTVVANKLGRVILPGLDLQLDDEAFQSVDEGHPQYVLKQFLEKSDIQRQDVRSFPENYRASHAASSYTEGHPASVKQAQEEKIRFISEMMRPSQSLDAWVQPALKEQISNAAIDHITLCEARSLMEEARIVACILRNILRHDGETAIVVTPNRKLAAMIQQEMTVWDVVIDDSAGFPLSDTSIGRFFLSALRMMKDHFAPISMLGFLKSYIALAQSHGILIRDQQAFMQRFELDFTRGIRLYQTLDDLDNAVQKQWENDKKLQDQWRLVYRMFTRLNVLLQDQKEQTIAHFTSIVLQALEDMLAASNAPESNLWKGAYAQDIASFFSRILEFKEVFSKVHFTQYVSLIERVMETESLRSKYGMHPRIRILGLMESRLQSADHVILSGLNEGSWPSTTAHSPWMSRPMADQFGLPRPERALTQSAHDFTQLACAPCVYMTRSLMMDGAPTVASRWLKRMDTLIDILGLDHPRIRGHRFVEQAQALHECTRQSSYVVRPAPSLNDDQYIERMAITDAAALMLDPYAFYAKRVLGLYPLDPIDQSPDHLLKGQIMHKAIELFLKKKEEQDPAGCIIPGDLAQLLEVGQPLFDQQSWNADVHAVWWPRFKAMASWFIDHEVSHRKAGMKVYSEMDGKLSINLDHDTKPNILLRGRIDRVEVEPDKVSIVDYKTGTQTPSKKDVTAGFAPQLVLGAVMVMQNGVEGLSIKQEDASKLHNLEYWVISGKSNYVASIAQDGTLDDQDIKSVCAASYEGLRAILCSYSHGAAFVSFPYGSGNKAAPFSGDYEHLSRLREWSVHDDDVLSNEA